MPVQSPTSCLDPIAPNQSRQRGEKEANRKTERVSGGNRVLASISPSSYRRLKAYLADRELRLADRVPLPHPVLRKR